ncbi:hypothetical protein IC611_16225 [Proteus mirabilis]
MSIKQTRYVDIASAVIGASTAPMRKLTARIFQQTLKFQQGKYSNLLLVKLMRFWGLILQKRNLPANILVM